ncbi:MAG: C40 family peptidase [Nitratireductor sp.]|uniref:C40 family peptidase n=1 Tax=Nitratireductor sp. TaxID=1872084 RepID=UPI002602FD8D|nr:NlpC/P60 family protein [Nitratireductor sp.]MCV0351593.1 C40 family peptidase [Nitratireductor sp.]
MHADRPPSATASASADLADAIVAEARTWLGVPWRHQGRSRAGVDCAGLVVLVARTLELADHDSTAYGRRAQGQGFVEHFRGHMEGIAVTQARPGDVLVFADQAYPCHCGFLTERLGRPHLLHAHATRRQVIEEPYAGEWAAKIKFAFRFRSSGY